MKKYNKQEDKIRRKINGEDLQRDILKRLAGNTYCALR